MTNLYVIIVIKLINVELDYGATKIRANVITRKTHLSPNLMTTLI